MGTVSLQLRFSFSPPQWPFEPPPPSLAKPFFFRLQMFSKSDPERDATA